MGGKVVFCVGVVAVVIFCLILMTAYWPIVTDAANYAASSTNATLYPEAKAAAAAAPWFLYFVPAIIGIVAIVIKLRQPEQP